MIEIADHLPQFISVNKDEVNPIKPNYFKGDNMFNEQEFLADIINNDWENNITDTDAKLYNIFIWDLEHYVNKHAPLKKREQKIKSVDY